MREVQDPAGTTTDPVIDVDDDRTDLDGSGPVDGDEHGDDGGDDDDDVIVLPWWQHPINILTIAVTAAILAGLIGWMIGDSNSGLEHSEVDTGFLQDMREHHEQAWYMGFLYRALPDIDPGLSTIAGSIIVGQSQDVGRMVQMLRMFGEPEANEGDTSMGWMGMPTERGNMPGMATDEQLEHLQTLSGAEADAYFVELMTNHHTGGVHMAEYAAEHAESDEVREMAASMAKSQQEEIAEMDRELASP